MKGIETHRTNEQKIERVNMHKILLKRSRHEVVLGHYGVRFPEW